ncbi:hypothetical protein OIU78_016489 [Salix suchowensis]|nr:hypothetical protein OIU78_016489 [Salix suchowensis]
MAPSISHASVLFTATVLTLLLAPTPINCWRPWPHLKPNSSDLLYDSSKKYEGSSEFVHLRYHMGPVLTGNITVHIIWYGRWEKPQKKIIREFINSISAVNARPPSVSGWWRTVQLYTDQTGANISHTVQLGQEKNDRFYSHGKSLTRLSIQSVIKSAVTAKSKPLPTNPRNGLYLLLTSADVYVQDFCGQVTVRSCVLACVPIHSLCRKYIPGLKALKSPNSDVGVDGMISVIAHEIAELATNPLVNAWYAGQDPSYPVEIADLCEGIYGTGGGGSYTGQMLMDHDGSTFNMHGIRRKYLVQWVWNHFKNYCSGPNALDQ